MMKQINQKNFEIIEFESVKKDDLKKNKLKRIGNINSLVSQIPTLIASKELTEAYRVIIPPGTSGKLMQYKDGLLGTPLLEDGKVVGHAGLESMSGIVTPMLIFTAMSVVTGQYFLSQINKTLNNVLNEIKNIKNLLLLKEESNLFSYSLFLKRITDNYSYINASSSLKTATLCNIQNTINELSASIYFYTQNSISELDKIKNTSFKDDLNTLELKQNLEKLKASLDLRNIFLILEFAFSQSFDKSTINSVRNSISSSNRDIFNPFIEKIFFTVKSMQEKLFSEANTLAKQTKLNIFIDDLKSLNTGINKKYIDNSNKQINDAFEKLELIDRDGTEYFILDNGVYTKA